LCVYVLCLVWLGARGQYCDQVSLIQSGNINLDFTYDTFGKYLSGITQNGVTRLKITVSNSINHNPDCRWNLVAYIDNGNGTTPNDEWESVYSQSSSGSEPKVELLQLRIKNKCNTSLMGDQFFDVPLIVGQPILIISNTGITVPAGSCTSNVNGPGNANANYDEYTFDVDYRLMPGVGLRSGVYQLRLKFVLIEAI
jgi:hypothetical protein